MFVLLFLGVCSGQTIVNAPATNSYFNVSMAGQVWPFTDSYGHHLNISVSQLTCAFGHCDQNILLLRFAKDSCFGYWNPRTVAQCAVAVAQDELWFVLAEGYQGTSGWVHDGAWRCIGFNYIDYLGHKHKVQIINQGQMAPYTIVPSAIGVPPYTYYVALINDAFTGDVENDFSPLSGTNCCTTPWLTDGEFSTFTSAFAGTITALVAWQYEGCVSEHWYYKQGVGLVEIFPTIGLGDGGACVSIDPGLAMVRTN